MSISDSRKCRAISASLLARTSMKRSTALVTRAINDVNRKNKLLLDEQQANTCIVNYMQKSKLEKSSGNKKIGENFLAANKTKPGVVVLPSGLQYSITKAGTGPKPTTTDKVVCNYRGTLINGTEFDSSYKHGQPATFPVTGVIKGWTEALQLMPVGSKWQLFIPSDLAYGPQARSAEIGPNATLLFELELLSIEAPAPPPDKK